MDPKLEELITTSVKEKNKKYKGNTDYEIIANDQVGRYTIYTVEFYDVNRNWYQNFCLTRDNKVLEVFDYIADIVRFIDRRFSWRALLIDQYALVAGSIVVSVLAIGTMVALITKIDVPQGLWVALSSAIGYLFGSKASLSSSKMLK